MVWYTFVSFKQIIINEIEGKLGKGCSEINIWGGQCIFLDPNHSWYNIFFYQLLSQNSNENAATHIELFFAAHPSTQFF